MDKALRQGRHDMADAASHAPGDEIAFHAAAHYRRKRAVNGFALRVSHGPVSL